MKQTNTLKEQDKAKKQIGIKGKLEEESMKLI
jgi:hypothetical protein